MNYGVITQQLSNHPDISATRMVDTEILFLRDEIKLLCNVYHVDSNGDRIHSISERLYTPSTRDSWVDPQTGNPAQKDAKGEPVAGSIPQIDYLINIPNQLQGSTTTYGNIKIVCQQLVASLDARGEFNI